MSKTTVTKSNRISDTNILSTIIGHSVDGMTIVDASWKSCISDLGLRFTVKYDGNHREPRRFYYFDFDGVDWKACTPEPPSICSDIVEWISGNQANIQIEPC